jgi:hypothetical protein
MRRKFHFDVSRQLFDQKIRSFLEDEEIKSFAKKYNVDLEKLKKDIQKTTFLDKFITLFT